MRSQKGSAAVLVLGISMASLISLGFVQYGIYQFRQVAQKSIQDERSVIALNSFFEYTLVGLKQGWCFTSTWQKEAPANCNLTHPANVARLFVNPSVEDAVRSSMVPNPSNPGFSPNPLHYNDPIKLTRIEQDVFLQSVAPGHPLLQMIQPILNLEYTHIRFTLRLIESADTPVTNEARLIELGVELLPNRVGARNKVAGQIMLFTRQLNQYALILPNDLNLDSNSHEYLLGDAQKGNSQIAKMVNWPSLNGQPSPGLRFESPVFINGNLIAPRAGVSPVAFLDKITLGGGIIRFADGEPFRPRTAGGIGDRYFSEVENFGGLFNGVELDPGRDRGLDVLYDLVSGTAGSEPGLCRLRFLARTDLTLTRNSELLKFVSPTTVTAQRPLVHFNLGSLNVFMPQSIGSGQALQFTHHDSTSSPSFKPTNQRLIAQETHYQNGAAIPGATGATVEVIGRVTVSFVGRPTPPPSPPAPAPTTDQLAERLETRVTFFVSKDDSDFVIRDWADNSAALHLQFRRAVVGGNRQPNEVRMEAWFENAHLFWNQQPTVISGVSYQPTVRVQFEAFDVAYFRGQSIRNFRQDRVSAYPNNVNASDTEHLYMGSRKVSSVVWERNNAVTPQRFDFRYVNSASQTVPAMTKWSLWSSCEDFSKQNCAPADANGIQAPQTWGFLARAIGHPLSDVTNERFLRMENNQLPVTPSLPGDPEYPYDWANFDSLCGLNVPAPPPPNLGAPQAFPFVNWYEDLSPHSKASWGFTEGGQDNPTPGYLDGVIELTDLDSSLDLGAVPPIYPIFNVRARVRDCVVRASANFVAGYFVCDRFTIEQRSSPLRIIGTVMTGQLSVHPTAITQGIRWSTIYGAAAPSELRRARILDTDPNWSGVGTPPLACEAVPGPAWIPYPAVRRMDQLKSCSPHLLARRADPFTWTSVSPDCAVISGGETQCKRQPINFLHREMSRWSE